jgi:hypothetical protein
MLPFGLVLSWFMYLDDASIDQMIERLGDARYAVRVSAQRTLQEVLLSEYGHLYRPKIEEATRHPDLEIARRASAILASYYDLRPGGYPVLPWIDMLPQGQPERQWTIDQCLSRVRPPGTWGYGSDWPEYRLATGVLTQRLLGEGYPRHCVRQLLDDMVNQERQYREKHGMRDLARRD